MARLAARRRSRHYRGDRCRAALRCRPDARRTTELAAAVGGLLGTDFRDRVLPFDQRCASRYADIACARETLGRPIGVADAQIAAICRTAEATLATRSTDDFSGTGIELINP